jgi:putative toxin-antitoxin system antitoxin component (TIGR02293 family)
MGLLKRSALEDRLIPRSLDLAGLLKNKIFLVHVIREGLPYIVFDLIRESSPFSMQDWAGFLDISSKSLQRYKARKSQFRSIHSEKILELAEVTHAGMEVFNDRDKLRQWLEAENYALGGMRPLDLLKDSYGKELVLSELTRIDEGIFV